MRLEIGPGGKIIGTRRVSPNGQVSGLSDYSGREVLVVLPDDGGSAASPSAQDLGQAVQDQIREAFERYRSLGEIYATPWEATRAFFDSALPTRLPNLMDQVNRWVEAQVGPHPTAREAPPSTSSSKTAPPQDPPSRGRRRPAGKGRARERP